MRGEVISASSLQTYIDCPHQFWFRYHSDYEPDPFVDNTALHIGSIIHKTLEELRKNPGIEFIDEYLGKTMESYEDYTLNNEEYNDVRRLIENWIKTRDLSAGVVDTEIQFKIPYGSFHLIGFIDLVELIDRNYMRVRDYKTGRNFKSSNDSRNSVQLKMYTLACMELYNVDNVEVGFDQLRFKPPEFIQYSKRDLKKFLLYLSTMQIKISNDTAHKPRIGIHCSWCNYARHCEYIQDSDINEFGDLSFDELLKKYHDFNYKERLFDRKKEVVREMITRKMEEKGIEEYNSGNFIIKQTQNEYKNYKVMDIMDLISLKDYEKVLSIKKGELEKILDPDKLDEIVSYSYSKPYINVKEVIE